MGLFDKIFGTNKTKPENSIPNNITFGRYSDNNKSLAKTNKWFDAEQNFKDKNYQKYFIDFFDYLKDDRIDNVKFEDKSFNDKTFQIYQGSIIVEGQINETKIIAKVAMASMEQLSIPVMRRLLEMNFSLYYTRFAIDGQHLYILFDGEIENTGPSKFYYALKEMATTADKQDDVLSNEFKTVKQINQSLIIPFADDEKEIKYTYFKKWIEETLQQIKSLNQDSFSGAIAYMLLCLIYKIDYLIVPEGKLLIQIEDINHTYWSNNENKTAVDRNQAMIESFQKLLTWNKEDILNCFYRTKSTFAITKPEPYETIINSINDAQKNMLWYRDNKYTDIAIQVMEYSISYCQYSYSMPLPFSQLVQLYMQINNADFFKDLGFSEIYFENGKLKFQEIKNKIDKIIYDGKEKYPSLAMSTATLSFTSLLDFNTTFIREFQNLNFDKK